MTGRRVRGLIRRKSWLGQGDGQPGQGSEFYPDQNTPFYSMGYGRGQGGQGGQGSKSPYTVAFGRRVRGHVSNSLTRATPEYIDHLDHPDQASKSAAFSGQGSEFYPDHPDQTPPIRPLPAVPGSPCRRCGSFTTTPDEAGTCAACLWELAEPYRRRAGRVLSDKTAADPAETMNMGELP